MISTRHLDVRFGDVAAVRDVSLDVPEGSVLAVLGPSGCGKSSLLRAIAGLEPVAGGQVLLDGIDLAGTPPHRRGFALMFQDGQLFAHQSVAGNIGYAPRIRHVSRAEVRRRVDELLEVVGLVGFGDRMPATLSGGERQRVALARALAAGPRLLLLDEPLSALDRNLRDRLAADLREILVRSGTTAVLVTHDHEEAFTTSDALAVMRSGHLVQTGSLTDVWSHPADPETALFLGYASVLTGDGARRILAAAGLPATAPGGLALRRSALRVSHDGALRGTVLSASLTPELLRLTVDVPDLGVLHAVARAGEDVPVGREVRLSVDPDRAAVLPTGGDDRSP